MGQVFKVEGIAPWPGLKEGQVYGDDWEQEVQDFEQLLADEKKARREAKEARLRKEAEEAAELGLTVEQCRRIATNRHEARKRRAARAVREAN